MMLKKSVQINVKVASFNYVIPLKRSLRGIRVQEKLFY